MEIGISELGRLVHDDCEDFMKFVFSDLLSNHAKLQKNQRKYKLFAGKFLHENFEFAFLTTVKLV